MTRRQLMGGMASVAASCASGQCAPAPEPAGVADDHVLLSLWRQFAEALNIYEEARQCFNLCEREFAEGRPPPPAILTKDGPLGHLLAKGHSWWTASELRFLIADGQPRAAAAKARSLLPTARAYEAKLRAARRKAGVPKAQAAHESAIDALDRLAGSILDAPARSISGIAVKARIVKSWGKPDWWNECDADPYEALAAQALDAVMAMAERGR